MNDKDRDRCSDGAGPVAKIENKTNKRFAGCKISRCGFPAAQLFCSVFFFLFSVGMLNAQIFTHYTLRGLSLTVDIGVLRPDNYQANFYNGNPDNVNTLNRILYSETYGNQIWNNLTTQDLIGDAVASYRQIKVAEYGDMYYKLAFQLGMGFRYDFEKSHWGWLLKFDYARLHSIGMVLLESGKGLAYLTNQDRYVNCPAAGQEERIYIDLGLMYKFKTRNGMDIELALGGNLNNTKVEKSDVQIGGISYSILDIWGGQSPSSYVASYDYINQGGIGYGGFAQIAFGFTLPAGTAMSLSYTFHYNKVNLQRYESFAPHHAIKLNVALNNFSFFDN